MSRYSNNGLKHSEAKGKIKRAISASVPGTVISIPTQSSNEHVKALSNKFCNNWSFNNE